MTILGEKYRVIVSNPIGSELDTNNNIIFEVNYGYVEGVIDAEGERQEAYILGINKPIHSFEGRLVAIIHRTNDIGNKWVISNNHYSKEEIEKQVSFMEKYFNIEIII